MFSKKKEKVFTRNRSLHSEQTSAADRNCYIKHRDIKIHRLRKVKSGFAKRAEIPKTGLREPVPTS